MTITLQIRFDKVQALHEVVLNKRIPTENW